ncbi:MAG: sterol desaturase family protein [Gammaproteobacteria bacterium]|nr:sterol desaturase family protein [Gammaproteobacteria bacterium]
MVTPFDSLFDGRERIFWLYLLTSLSIALLLLLRPDTGGRRLLSLAGLKSYWWSADARLDYRYFLINWLIKTLLIAPLIVSAQSIALWTLNILGATAEPLFLQWYYRDIVFAYTLTLFLVGDFSRYWLHRAMHRCDWLWAFHKVHHSAEALNPLTFYRVHPLENLLFALRHALVAGAVTGVFIFCFGAQLDLYSIFGSNLFVVCLSAFTSNLRHSHVRLGYGRWLETLLISPAQHQVHHTPGHTRHNYGSVLALWDWLFGSLRRSHQVGPDQPFGLGEGQRLHYDGVRKLLTRPFFEIQANRRRVRS